MHTTRITVGHKRQGSDHVGKGKDSQLLISGTKTHVVPTIGKYSCLYRSKSQEPMHKSCHTIIITLLKKLVELWTPSELHKAFQLETVVLLFFIY